MEAVSQYHKNYWRFASVEEVTKPFEYARTLSNGIVIGRSVDAQEYGFSKEEIDEYIKNNHEEPQIEEI